MLGFLDGVANGEVFGWAFDPERSNEPVRVTAVVNGEPVAEALALFERQDVGERMSSRGYHGYFIDLRQYCKPAEKLNVEVIAEDGTLLGNSPLETELAHWDTCEDPTVLLMHIPKTAGTSLREVIAPNYRLSEVASLYPDPLWFPAMDSLWKLPLQQRNSFRFIIGHFSYGIHKSLSRPAEYITILRHPTKRALSQYFHFVREQPQVVTEETRTLTFSEALESKIHLCLDNVMVRTIAGLDPATYPLGSIDHVAYEMAWENLRTQFAYVGFQEDTEKVMGDLERRYKWTRRTEPLPVQNVGNWSLSPAEWAEADAAVRHFDQWDVLLYEQARSLWGRQMATR